MKSQSNLSLNWTNNTKIKTKFTYPKNILSLKKILKKDNLITTGNQRSYGDIAINSNCIVSMKKFNKVINFDKKKGVIELQSGVVLSEILELIIDNGWFFPVTPGTKYVSIGGMIANNVHGKKTSRNQMKYYVKEIKLMIQNKKIIKCSSVKNKKIFDLTIGGFGLTGVILSAKIKLKKINSALIDQKVIGFSSYDQFFAHSSKIKKYEYYVSWIQYFDNQRIKGLSYFGNHSKDKKKYKIKIRDQKLNLFYYSILKLFTQNYYCIKILNFFHQLLKSTFYKKTVNLYDYFYPQDKFINWNKLYGKSGFVQIQFLIKKNDLINVMGDISAFFKKEKKFSPFVVIKNYNETGSYLNFVGKGISISMDMKIDKEFYKVKTFFNNIFIKYGALVNLSKDFIAEKKIFDKNQKYRKFKNDLKSLGQKSKFSSNFSERLGL